MTGTATLSLLSGCATIEDEAETSVDSSEPLVGDTATGKDTSATIDTHSNPDTGAAGDTGGSIDTGEPPEQTCRPTAGSSQGPYWVACSSAHRVRPIWACRTS